MSRRQSTRTPELAHPLDDEDLLEEILLRLPPQPSSLPCASLVCKHWRSMLSDPQFLKRFRKHHKKPPLLGFFVANFDMNPVFTPVPGLLNGIPPTRFSVPHRDQWHFMGCRHGLAVLTNDYERKVVVWDPLTGQQHHVPYPRGLRNSVKGRWRGCQAAVLCADAEDGHVHGDCFLSLFRLVLISGGRKKTFACLYESSSSIWGNIASMVSDDVIVTITPSVVIGNSVYWLFAGGDIIVFDIERQTLGVIQKPALSGTHIIRSWCFQLLRTDDVNGLVFALLSIKNTIHLWEMKMNSDGIVGWVLQQKIIELEGMFPWGLPSNDKWVFFAGCDEDRTVIVLSTWIGTFMLKLDSMQIKKISENNNCYMVVYPYANFFTAGREVGWKWLDLKL